MKSLLPFALCGVAMLLWVLVVFSTGFAKLMKERPLASRVARLGTLKGLKEAYLGTAFFCALLMYLAPAGPVVAFKAWQRHNDGASVVGGNCTCACGLVEDYHPLARMWPLAEPLRELAAGAAAAGPAETVAARSMAAFAAAGEPRQVFGPRERVMLRELAHAEDVPKPERNPATLAMAAALKDYRRTAGADHAAVEGLAKEELKLHLGRMSTQVMAAYCRVSVEATLNATGERVTLADVGDVGRHEGLQAITRSASWHSGDYATLRWRLLDGVAAGGPKKDADMAVFEMQEHEEAHASEARSWAARTCGDDFEPVECYGILNHHTGRMEDLVTAELQHAEYAAERLTELPSSWSIFVDTFIFSLLVYNFLSAVGIVPWLGDVFGDEEEEEENKDGEDDPDLDPLNEEAVAAAAATLAAAAAEAKKSDALKKDE